MKMDCSHDIIDCICSLEEALEYGWKNVQQTSRPDESFRAMIKVMMKWKKYMDAKETNISSEYSFQSPIVERLISVGEALAILKYLQELPVFQNISKHNPYWESSHSEEDDKLHDIRLSLSHIDNIISDVRAILRGDHE